MLGDLGEIFGDEGIRVIELSVVVVQVVMPDLVHSVDHYLWDPLLPDLPNPVVVEVSDRHLQVRHFVSWVQLHPLLYVQHLHLPFLCALFAHVPL